MPEMENSWVLFELNKQQYGIRTEHVREMVTMKDLSKLPDAPAYLRGVINLRGIVIPVVDLRKRLGFTSALDEMEALVQLLLDREKDHINWLTELRKTVEENYEFKLATDPHKCAFGKWYDSYTTSNHLLAMQLRKFDEPHKRIHGIAVKVKELEKQGKTSEAIEMIEHAWNHDLSAMRELFAETIAILRTANREIIIIGEHDNTRIGYVVDSVSEVIDLPANCIEPPPKVHNGHSNRYIQGLGKTGEDVKILLDIRQLLFYDDLARINHLTAS